MSAREEVRVPGVYRMLLRAAARGVPRARRAEWAAEWNAELWYVCEAALPDVRGQWEVARFCGGAMVDAWCVRGMAGSRMSWEAGSAAVCVGWLGLVVLVCVGLAHVLPRVREAVWPRVVMHATDVVTISPVGWSEAGAPGNRMGEVRAWERRRQHLFAEFGFYEPVVKAVHVGAHDAPELHVARGSANVLEMLGARVRFRPASLHEDGLPALVLSERVWRTRFGGRREVFGQTIRVGLERVRVAGVVDEEAMPVGRRVDVWMLLPAASAERLPDDARVFAFGRVIADAQAGAGGERWPMSVDAETEHRRDYECVGLWAGQAAPWRMFAFTVFLALLALPATTSLPLGEYPARSMRLRWSAKLRRWMFLGAKMALLAPAVCFLSMDVAYGVGWANPHMGEYSQLVTSFCGMLFGLRWCLRDQRQRCPVCLGRLTCPVRVGQPSRNFLAWNGTELICEGGHGLLHVPELPTSWFGSPRWLHLDPSWSGLFLRAV